MPNSFLNPRPSDYPAHYRLGGIAVLLGIALIVFGLSLGSGWLTTLLAGGGIGLSISGAAILRTAYNSQQNARRMRSGSQDDA